MKLKIVWKDSATDADAFAMMTKYRSKAAQVSVDPFTRTQIVIAVDASVEQGYLKNPHVESVTVLPLIQQPSAKE